MDDSHNAITQLAQAGNIPPPSERVLGGQPPQLNDVAAAPADTAPTGTAPTDNATASNVPTDNASLGPSSLGQMGQFLPNPDIIIDAASAIITGSTTTGTSAAGVNADELSGPPRLSLPDSDYITKAKFIKNNDDLYLELRGGENSLLIDGYFSQSPRPILLADGTHNQLSPALVDSLLTLPTIAGVNPANLASNQDWQQQISTLTEAGIVTGVADEIYITRKGQDISLKAGDKFYVDDDFQTGPGGLIKLQFNDGTIFALGENGRVVIDEMIFDPAAKAGQLDIKLLIGQFLFVSGDIAKSNPDDMMIYTPSATIGIRGTIVSGRVDADGGFEHVLLDGAIVTTPLFSDQSLLLQNSFEGVRGFGGDSPLLDPQFVRYGLGEIIGQNLRVFASLSDDELNRIESDFATSAAEQGQEFSTSLGDVIDQLLRTQGLEQGFIGGTVNLDGLTPDELTSLTATIYDEDDHLADASNFLQPLPAPFLILRAPAPLLINSNIILEDDEPDLELAAEGESATATTDVQTAFTLTNFDTTIAIEGESLTLTGTAAPGTTVTARDGQSVTANINDGSWSLDVILVPDLTIEGQVLLTDGTTTPADPITLTNVDFIADTNAGESTAYLTGFTTDLTLGTENNVLYVDYAEYLDNPSLVIDLGEGDDTLIFYNWDGELSNLSFENLVSFDEIQLYEATQLADIGAADQPVIYGTNGFTPFFAGDPLVPDSLAPDAGFTITGTAAPNDEVEIIYEIEDANGDAAITQSYMVTADIYGNWSLDLVAIDTGNLASNEHGDLIRTNITVIGMRIDETGELVPHTRTTSATIYIDNSVAEASNTEILLANNLSLPTNADHIDLGPDDDQLYGTAAALANYSSYSLDGGADTDLLTLYGWDVNDTNSLADFNALLTNNQIVNFESLEFFTQADRYNYGTDGTGNAIVTSQNDAALGFIGADTAITASNFNLTNGVTAGAYDLSTSLNWDEIIINDVALTVSDSLTINQSLDIINGGTLDFAAGSNFTLDQDAQMSISYTTGMNGSTAVDFSNVTNLNLDGSLIIYGADMLNTDKFTIAGLSDAAFSELLFLDDDGSALKAGFTFAISDDNLIISNFIGGTDDVYFSPDNATNRTVFSTTGVPDSSQTLYVYGNDFANDTLTVYNTANLEYYDGGAGGGDILSLDGATISFTDGLSTDSNILSYFQVNRIEFLELQDSGHDAANQLLLDEAMVKAFTETLNHDIASHIGTDYDDTDALIIRVDDINQLDLSSWQSAGTITGQDHNSYSVYTDGGATLYITDVTG